MFVPLGVDSQSGHQHQVVADVQTVDLNDQEIQLGEVRPHPLGQPLGGQRYEPARRRRFRGAVPDGDRQIALGKPHGAAELARRDVDQHQVHGPAAKPVLGLGRCPGRQLDFLALVAAYPRAMHGNPAAVKADLSLGQAPTVTDPAFAPAMRGAGKLLCVLTQHSLEGSDAGRQAEALERALHTLPSRFKAWGKRNPCRCGNLRHGVALLCGFVTPSLAAQGGQRLLPYFNISRDIPIVVNHKVMRLMKEHGLTVQPRRRYVVTTDSDHDGPIFPNLAKEVTPTGPNQLWVADITYIAIARGFVYLAAILDAWSRRVIGYAVGA